MGPNNLFVGKDIEVPAFTQGSDRERQRMALPIDDPPLPLTRSVHTHAHVVGIVKYLIEAYDA